MILGNTAIRNKTITGFTMKFRRLVLLFYILIIIQTEFDYCCNAEPAQGISELSGCLGPPWPPEGPQE